MGKSFYFACMVFDFTFVCYNAELRGERIDHEVPFKKAFPFIVHTNGMREKWKTDLYLCLIKSNNYCFVVTALSVTFSVSNLSTAFFLFFFLERITSYCGLYTLWAFFFPLVNKAHWWQWLPEVSLNFGVMLRTLVLTYLFSCPDLVQNVCVASATSGQAKKFLAKLGLVCSQHLRC